MKKFFKSLMLISVCLGLSATVNAKTFRYATTGDILGLDPHANNEGPTNTCLLYTSPSPRDPL